MASPMILSDKMVDFVIGGINQLSSEYLLGKVWSSFNLSPLPTTIFKSCIVATESKKLFLIGGNQGNCYLKYKRLCNKIRLSKKNFKEELQRGKKVFISTLMDQGWKVGLNYYRQV